MPTLGKDNPSILKKLPSRWRKNATIIASLGLVGALALSGCGDRNMRPRNIPHDIVHDLGYIQDSYNGYSESEILVRLHTGGFGNSVYIVHLTEQEAFGIIRGRLEAAGLVFGDVPPDYSSKYLCRVEAAWKSIELDLYDAQRGVAIAHVSWLGTHLHPSVHQFAKQLTQEFAEIESDITVGVFYNPGMGVGGGGGIGRQDVGPPSEEAIAASPPILKRQLINQADAFIARLQSQGILERFAAVRVVLNGRQVNFGSYPIIINNHKMAPAYELFELLGMDIESEDNITSRSITATRGDYVMNIRYSLHSGGRIRMLVDDEWEWVSADIPVIDHNGNLMVPIQFVARALGADVEWDEENSTMRINMGS